MDGKKEKQYRIPLKANVLDVEAGKLISIMNVATAKELGINPLERAELFNPETQRSVVTVVDVSSSFIGPKEIGIFHDAAEKLRVESGVQLEVCAVGQPRSLRFIRKKLDGETLAGEELNAIVEDLDKNKLSEIEAAAFVSAVYIHGFNLQETVDMTKALTENGLRVKIERDPVVDKHSIGGTNGRVTMVIVPILAAAGVYCPKTSSRSITSAAGTADAMDVLANVALTVEQIKEITEKVGAVMAWGGAIELAPVDDKIIKIEHPLALDPPGQVIASVMAKKSSVSSKYVVIDIPVGPAMKVQSEKRAEELAQRFIQVGREMGMKVEAVITDATQPSGPAFGPALEARHALEVLEGKTYDSMALKALELSGVALELSGKVAPGKGMALAKETLQSGAALGKMQEIIRAQGKKHDASQAIPVAPHLEIVRAPQAGEVAKMRIRNLIRIARTAGAPADQLAGVLLKTDIGKRVKKGDALFEIHAMNTRKLSAAKALAISLPTVEMEKIIMKKIV